MGIVGRKACGRRAIVQWALLATSGVVAAAPRGALESGLTLAALVEKVGRSVVNIQTTLAVESKASYTRYLQGMGQIAASPLPAKPEATQTSLGSGFVVYDRGNPSTSKGLRLREMLILTNHHVVEGAQVIEVLVAGSNYRFEAKVAGSDAVSDVAVLRARLPADIPVLELGSSADIRVGESVFAIGNPFGLGHSVTSGIVSAKDRSLGLGRIDRYLQTDAAINFGNSGGPLFNSRGQVVGINTLIRADAVGIGFAIPSDTVKGLIPLLEQGGAAHPGWLGVQARVASSALLAKYHAAVTDERPTGVVVVGVYENSPAAKIGLREGDLLTDIKTDGAYRRLRHPLEIKDRVDAAGEGRDVELLILRGGKKLQATLKVEKIPAPVLGSESVYESY